MPKRKCYTFHKLSKRIRLSSRLNAKQRLASLIRLLRESEDIEDEIGKVYGALRSVGAPNEEPFVFSEQLAQNEHLLRMIFDDCDDVKFRKFQAGGRPAFLAYVDGMADLVMLERNVLRPLMQLPPGGETLRSLEEMETQLLTAVSLAKGASASQAVFAIMTGSTVLMFDGNAEPIVIDTKKYVKRDVGKPSLESNIRGPQDAFNETLADNLVLMRRRSRDPNLKIRMMEIGKRNQIAMALVYVADLVKPGLVEEVERRLQLISADTVIVSQTIEELMIEHPWSPFPQAQSTERPDKAVAAVYDGRVAILLDNTPATFLVPCNMATLMQSVDDYTMMALPATLLRITRYFALFLAVYLPAIYVSVVSFHPGMMPTTMAITVAELRARTPFPAFMEALIMIVLLEIFQEAIMRLPNKVVVAASVMGGFVIGNAIVQAGVIGPLLVVFIATTAIASYTTPVYGLGVAIRVVRLMVLMLASLFGLYGTMLGFLILAVHLCSIRNFGEAYFGNSTDLALLSDWKDMIFSFPYKYLQTRPKVFGAQKRHSGANQP